MSENGWAEERTEFAVPLADESMVVVDVPPWASITSQRLNRLDRHATPGRLWPTVCSHCLRPSALSHADPMPDLDMRPFSFV
jgi:hypothetical protein